MKFKNIATLLAVASSVDAQYLGTHVYASPSEASFPGYCFSYAVPNCRNWASTTTNQGPYYTGPQAGVGNAATTPPAGGTWSSIALANNYIFDPANCASFCGAQAYYQQAIAIRSDNAC
jgi:hypothetical protein